MLPDRGGTSSPGPDDHLLLTVLGTNPKETCYHLENRSSKAILAPVALLELLPASERPSHVVAFCTPKAEEESWGLLKKALRDQYQEVKRVPIPSASPEQEINDYLEKVTKCVPKNAKVTVDITHGPRHFALLMYIAILYLAALRGVKVSGAYYGFFGDPDKPSLFLNLQPLLKLPDWIYALKVMKETGSTLPLAKVVEKPDNCQKAKQISNELKYMAEEYLSGLPIELGRRARNFRKEKNKSLRHLLKDDGLPCNEELVSVLDEILKPWALESDQFVDKRKKTVKLSKCEELDRQAKIIDNLFHHDNISIALGLLSEWTISWTIWNSGKKEQWLNHKKERLHATNKLRVISENKDIQLSPDLNKLGEYWKYLKELRNGYAHHGMRPQHLMANEGKSRDQIEKVRCYWKETLKSCPRFDFSPIEACGWVLVSPIGMRSGVLFSALKACQEKFDEPPVQCLVVCSDQTKDEIPKAVDNAGYKGKVTPLLLKDPHGGLEEIGSLRKKSRPYFINATEVVVNVTGGTTVMGLAVQALAETARSLARPVRRCGLIDRRTHDQQKADPYKMGELFWIDSGDAND